MSLNKFASSELIRAREGYLNFSEADVYIAMGNLDGVDLPGAQADFANFLDGNPMKTIGVNSKESPVFTVEDIVEEVDYENISLGVKVSGEIKVKLINTGFIRFIEDELRNVEVTVLLVPKNYEEKDACLFISGVKLQSKLEGKGNNEESPVLTFNFVKKAGKISDVLVIYNVPK